MKIEKMKWKKVYSEEYNMKEHCLNARVDGNMLIELASIIKAGKTWYVNRIMGYYFDAPGEFKTIQEAKSVAEATLQEFMVGTLKKVKMTEHIEDKIHAFLEWLEGKGVFLASYYEEAGLSVHRVNIQELLAEFFDLEKEKRVWTVTVRAHLCMDCDHMWAAKVELSKNTTNLSGEKTQWCPHCGSRRTVSSPVCEIEVGDED